MPAMPGRRLRARNMISNEIRALKQALLREYGHFSDKRIKNIDKGSSFIVDDRVPQDHDARGELFLWFCGIFGDVVDAQTVRVILRGGVPRGTSVNNWAKRYGVTSDEVGLSFSVKPADLRKLIELATAVRSIVRPGVRYPVKAYKYVCPRVAAALDRLHEVLANHWGSTTPSVHPGGTDDQLPL
jgi:hypothetical protein